MLHTLLGCPRSVARCLRQAPALNQRRRCLVTLAIETSCDDTCVAVLEYNKDGGHSGANHGLQPRARLHFHEKVTAPNTGKGGIVPIEAANSHRANLGKLVQKALRCRKPWHTAELEDAAAREDVVPPAKQSVQRPDFVSVARGPGMHSNLSCGLDTAKGLAAAFDVPLIGVHHMQAHALTPRLMYALQQPRPVGDAVEPAFPFLTLLVSGGHTMLLQSESLTSHSILADTMDIAIGDCLDKCGRAILPDSIRAATSDTAFGKHMSKYAFPDPSTFPSYPIPTKRSDEIDKAVNEYGWRIQPPLGETRKMAFSYAGFVSHVQRIAASKKTEMDEAERLALARAALGTAFEHLCSRLIIAVESIRAGGTDLKTLVVSGGVAANDFLRYFLRGMLDVRGFRDVQLIFPPIRATFSNQYGNEVVLEPCTDNAAMIAWAGMEMYNAGWYSDLGINAIPKWSLDASIDGGIAGVTSRRKASEIE